MSKDTMIQIVLLLIAAFGVGIVVGRAVEVFR